MKKQTIQEIAARDALILEKFPDAYLDRHYVDGLGAIRNYFSPSAKPSYLSANIRLADRELMLMATDAIETADGHRYAILHPETVAVPWCPVLRTLKVINPEAYAALLDVVVRMQGPRRMHLAGGSDALAGDVDAPAGPEDVDAVITAELARERGR